MYEDDDVEELCTEALRGHIYLGLDKIGEKYDVYLGTFTDKISLARFKTEVMARNYFNRLCSESAPQMFNLGAIYSV